VPHFADRYELLRLLGRGGMGEVHLARDNKFDRLVALKFFRENPQDADARGRFLREATMAGRLLNPHIVTVYDFGEHERELYIAMEYIAGDSLAHLIRRREPQSLHDRVRLAIELCSGLAAAHDAGVLHRDIKPENLMLTPGGGLKIVDFGIARALASPRTVTWVGSLHYMSPEQLTQAPLDARSDIFAAGAVIYELLSFKQAFPADSFDGIVQQIRFGTPMPLGELCPGLDPSLIAIVERALQKTPGARFAGCREMERALRAVLPRLPADDADVTLPIVARGPRDAQPPLSTTLPTTGMRGKWARLQTRLLDAQAYADYAWLAVAGVVPLLIALAVGAYADSPLDRVSPVYDACVAAIGGNPVLIGYGSRLNWWPSFVYLPFALFVLRRAAARLFPAPGVTAEVGIVRKIPPRGRRAVAADLAFAAHDPRNLAAVAGLIVVMTALDLRETAAQYASAFSGDTLACPRELDWTVQFVAGRVSVSANAWLVVLAYSAQVLLHSLGVMLVVLLFRHNLFYLRRVYQRHRAPRHSIDEQVVLDFDDVERCFGLRALHGTFNYQILMLIIGGLLMIASRLMNVDRTPIGLQYEAALSTLLPDGAAARMTRAAGFGLADLFPDVGQIMLAIGWVVCFVVVAMPSFVKFLPLADKRVRLVGRLEYLLEFIPPTTSVPTSTPEEVDRLAMKFARSSFWPAGDERARTLYTIAYFVFFMMVVPVPPTSSAALAMHVVAMLLLSFVTMKLTFWLFKKTLMNIDASLART
jgi:predicted Ser/Thr protein kinase